MKLWAMIQNFLQLSEKVQSLHLENNVMTRMRHILPLVAYYEDEMVTRATKRQQVVGEENNMGYARRVEYSIFDKVLFVDTMNEVRNTGIAKDITDYLKE